MGSFVPDTLENQRVHNTCTCTCTSTCSDMNPSCILSFMHGSTKGKPGSKVQKTHFLLHCVHRVQASPTCCPPPKIKRRAKAHRALGNCDRMHEQTDFSTFCSSKSSKRAIFTKKRILKGEINGFFQKRAKKGEKRGEHLWERAILMCQVTLTHCLVL